MNDFNKTKLAPFRVKSYVWILIISWTVMVAASLMWNVYQQRRDTLEMARIQARSAYEKDRAYRSWNASHGGVYVPMTKNTQPNPHLSNIPDRDIKTHSGKLLTLMNPSYMTRQVYELTLKKYGVRNHLTSLRPIRPQNAADPWETEALQAFERGETEISSVEDTEGEEYMRLMRPLFTEKICLKCHEAQGYKVGDIRGGISVSVPMAALWAIERRQMFTLSLGHIMLWLLGLGSIGVGTLRFRQRVRERDRLEAALREREERYRGIFNESVVAIYVFDNKKRFIDSNQAGLSLLGYSREELLSMSIPDVDADPIVVLPAHEQLFSGAKIINYEHKLKRKDGTVITVLNNSKPLTNDDAQVVGMQSTLIDITERNRSEEALRESEKRYRGIVEDNTEFIIRWKPDGTRTYANNAYCKYLNQPLEKVIGSSVFITIVKEDRNKLKHTIESLSVGNPVAYTQERKEIEGSRVVWQEWSERGFFDEDGKLVEIQSVGRDITSLIQAEAEKVDAEKRLRQVQKMEAIGTLAGGIAHDFNNLLMGMQGRVSLLQIGKDASHPDSAHFKGIEDNIKSAADLTTQLLGFAKGGKYEAKPTNLNEIVNKSADMFGRTKKEIIIHKTVQKEIWTVEVDQGQIEQVLLNLYINAWQAMSGIGEIYLETKNVIFDESYIKPYGTRPGRYVKISITDTGIGMNKETQQRIFDPFFTTKEMSRGTGMGLASAYGIIKNHKGMINVYSEEGKGATFNIYLPVTDTKGMVQRAESERSAEILRGTETVLLVDDEEIIIDVGQALLNTLGYSVLLAKSGKEAIEILKKNKDKIDMVLLDMIMPQMGGSDTYDRLKEINPDIKVLLSSGYSINGPAKEILSRGCNGFIQKPFSMKDLSQKLREILDKM